MKKNWKKYLTVLVILAVLIAGANWAGTLDEPHAENGVYAASRSSTLSSAKLAPEAAFDTTVEESADFGASGTAVSASGASMPNAQQRKLVRTADMTIRTRQFDEAAQSVQELLAEAGGYIESLYEHGETGSRRLSLYMHVPSAELDDFLLAMEGAGRITDRSESTTDMTTQYQDNEARLKTLYDKRARLNELMLKAENVSDLIEIESAIADTQYQIDRYETSQRSIDRQVDMSAVSVNLIEDRPADTAQADLTLTERIRAGLEASVEAMGEFARNMVVFLAVILPWAVPVIAVVVVIHIIRKRKKGSE